MDARITPDRPQYAVLDVVERELLAFDLDQFLLPWPNGEQTGRGTDIENAGHRLVAEYHLHRQGVVKVDPIGKLLGVAKTADRGRREGLEIDLELAPAGDSQTR